MKRHGGKSKTNHTFNTKSVRGDCESPCYDSVNESATEYPDISRSATNHKGRRKSARDSLTKHQIELSVGSDTPRNKPTTRSSRNSSLDSNSSSNLPAQSVNEDKEISTLEKGVLVSLNKNLKQGDFECLKIFGLKTKSENIRCKRAVVYLKDYLKVKKEPENGFDIDCLDQRYSVKMKPGGSRSPKRHSPLRGNVTTTSTKDSAVVRTTYVKPNSKDTVTDGKTSVEGRIQTSADQDELSLKNSSGADSPKMKKKYYVAMRKDSVGLEQSRLAKKRNPAVQGDSVDSGIESSKTNKKAIDSGQGDTVNHKDAIETETMKTPKKRGRKPKSADSSPTKEDKNSPESNPGSDFTPDIVITPPKDNRKMPKSPRSRKKKGDNETLLDNMKPNTDTLENEKLKVKSKSRGSSESPSPVRRKRSPKQQLEGKESPKSKKLANDQKSKTDKIQNENDEKIQEVSEIIQSHVDKVIDDVVNRNIEMLNKYPPEKSPSKKSKKQESPEKKSNSPNKEKKSPKKKSQEKETCSVEKKTPRSRSNSASPKKEKKKLEPKPGTSDDSISPSRKLDFDDDITKVILEKSKLPFPSDFHYKYTSSSMGCLGLNDLISKVDKSVKNMDDNLTALFGKVDEPDYSEGKSPCSMDTDVNISTDSDKTITEFGDTHEKLNRNIDLCSLNKDNDNNKENDSAKDVESSLLENMETDTPEKVEESNSNKEKEQKDMSDMQLIDNADESADRETNHEDTEEDKNNSSGDCDTALESESKIDRGSDAEGQEVVNENENIETVSVFEMFGLTLKKPKSKNVNDNEDLKEMDDCDKANTDEETEKAKTCENNQEETLEKPCENEEKVEDDKDDDVLFVSETKPDDSIVILSDDDEEVESKGIDRSGYESLKESIEEKRLKPKLTTVNNVVEPKPLDILYKLERADSKKENAFTCNELEEYLDVNKENFGPMDITPSKEIEYSKGNKNTKVDVKEELKKAEPDFDEIGGHVFISFATEHALNAHVSLEKKMEWLTEAQLKKMAHLKHMKERQQDSGSRRVTDVKSGDEQKQNFRGIPMRMMKYQKMLKQELEDMLLGRQPRSPEKSPSKTPTKTTDITKIKGWKSKFQNPEEMQEATGLNISESGKVHWRTEERLVKNLDPEEIRDIGLDLKKKRRKLVNYSNKRKSGHNIKAEDKESEMMEYEYEIDDMAIIESDVYNEDEDKPPPEKLPYYLKYSSQHKYGARKLFVKRMKLDAEDERILQKLGTQKQIGHKPELASVANKRKKGKQMFALCKLTHTMAMAAVSAFDKHLLNRAKGMEKAESTRKKKKEARSAKKGHKAPVLHTESPEIKEEVDLDQHFDIEGEAQYDDVESDNEEHVMEVEEDRPDNEDSTPEGKVVKKRRYSSASRGNQGDMFQEELKVEIKRESPDTCTQPGPYISSSCTHCKDCYLGCRYGCICHLCKLSDSGEEKETDFKPPCDKEYCRLGCICESIDTNAAETEHCRKPSCMFKCKCPPKQPKPDIPRERDHGKKKKGRGGKKKKRSPEKMEFEGSGKEEEVIIGDDNDWEPPSKRKRGPSNSRFANLPKRETTYRLAKNLDAVSRKAMEVYASSEMFTEQKVRRRRSDQAYEDGYYVSPEFKDSQERRQFVKQEGKLEPRLNEETGVLEISDDESDDEVYPEDFVSCSRIQPYAGPYKQKRDISQLNKRKGGPSSSSRKPSNTVIDLVDSDKEDNSGDNKGKSDLPSTSSGSRPQSLTEKMGLTNRLLKKLKEKKPSQDGAVEAKWKTQMVCLKAKKKSDDKSQDAQAEIKLLEIMSNCNWEIDRTNMLSKISHIISKDYMCDTTKSQFIVWGAYLLEFLPKADKPAVIPPELKPKLPNEMYSIRIKVTNNVGTDEKKEQKAEETVTVVDDGPEGTKSKEMSDEERKRYNMKLQKKLIDKIKFAERLRNLIIAEEQKGVTASKFSVSREGIEKALKKYKTQLWKAYTGSSNFTIQQLKQALHAAKSSGNGSDTAGNKSRSTSAGPGAIVTDSLSTSTMERIQSNQGVTVVTTVGQTAGHHSFINLANLQQGIVSSAGAPIKSVGNIVIHGTVPSHSHNQGQGIIDNIENIKKLDGSLGSSMTQAPKGSISASKIHQISSVNSSVSQSISGSDVVFMPLDKNIHPSQLPPGAKIAVMQPILDRDGSPVPFAGQPPAGGGPFRAVVLPNVSQMSGFPMAKPFLNPALTSLAANHPVHSQILQGPSSPGVISSMSGPHSVPRMPCPASTVNSSGNGVFVNGTGSGMRAGFPRPQYMGTVTLPNSSNASITLDGLLPLKNISNLGPVMSSGNSEGTLISSNGSAVAPGASSIYPIRFAPETSGKMHVALPPKDMIGFPKVASMPFKIVPDGNGKQMLLVPVTSSVVPSSTSSSLSANVVSQSGTGPMVVRPNATFAVPVSDSSVTLNLQDQSPVTNLSVQRKGINAMDIKQNTDVHCEENTTHKSGLYISDNEIAQGKTLRNDGAKTVNGECGEICDSVHIESDGETGDVDSLGSSSKSLSSLSDIMKTDINAFDVKLDATSSKTSENVGQRDAARQNKSAEHTEINDILDIAKSAGIEIANTLELIDRTDKERNGSNPGLNLKSNVRKEKIRNDSKTDSDCVVLDDTDEECLVIDEQQKSEQIGTNCDETKHIAVGSKDCSSSEKKRKRSSPDLIDNIDWEQEIRIMEDYMEKERMERNKPESTKEEQSAIRIDDSEESDVDVTSYDCLESIPHILSDDSTTRQAVQQGQNKRKSRHTAVPYDDEFQIRKYRIEVNKDPSRLAEEFMSEKSIKVNKEKFRRLELRNLFTHVQKTVFKYNSAMQQYTGKVPKHMILQEALNILSALNQRQELLKECLEDGQQYEKTLEAQLKHQIDSFVESGVPEEIIKNFLKSVEKSILPKSSKRKRRALQSFSSKQIEISDSEDSDSALEYEPLTPSRFTEVVMPAEANKTADSDPVIVENPEDDLHSVCNLPDSQSEIKSGCTSSPVKIFSGDSVETRQVTSNVEYQDRPAGCSTSEQTDPIDSAPNNEQRVGASVTPGQKSSSDDDEIRSSTGDTLMEHDHDFVQNEQWSEISQSEDLLQIKDIVECESKNVT